MAEPFWLTFARRDIGLKEIPGARHEPRILQMWRRVGAWFSDDETPWCGGFMGQWFIQCGIAPPKDCWRAKNWLEWGKAIDEPVLGCVVIFGRDGGAHVAYVVGKTSDGYLACLGGNQGNTVSIAKFPYGRVLGYRIPPGDRQYDPLPVLEADLSPSEA
jgi:uncharacterized protein (TIGR02594 family)